MRRVPTDESPAVAEPARDQTARNPILFGNNFIAEIGIDAEDRTQTGVAVYRLEIVFIGAEVIVNQPRRAAVDGIDIAAALRVDRESAPRRFRFQTAEQGRRPDIRRLHAAYFRVTLQFCADPPARLCAGPLAP